jgi:hypothetical protein
VAVMSLLQNTYDINKDMVSVFVPTEYLIFLDDKGLETKYEIL